MSWSPYSMPKDLKNSIGVPVPFGHAQKSVKQSNYEGPGPRDTATIAGRTQLSPMR